MWVYIGDAANPYNVVRLYAEPEPRWAGDVPQVIINKPCWPMPTAATTAWSWATTSPEPAAGRMRGGSSSMRKRSHPQIAAEAVAMIKQSVCRGGTGQRHWTFRRACLASAGIDPDPVMR